MNYCFYSSNKSILGDGEMLKCPKCSASSKTEEWDKTTDELCNGEAVPLHIGFGRIAFGYHCPSCFQFSSGDKLKNSNPNVIIRK